MSGTVDVTRPAIPAVRMRELVGALLPEVELTDVRSIEIDRGAITIEIYPRRADDGKRFRRGDGVAVDRVTFPIDWEAR